LKEDKEQLIKILICDDDPADRKLIRSVLQQIVSTEFAISEAGSATDIQKALNNSHPDLILLDLIMPEKSGMEWLDEIVQKGIAPVIVITGLTEEENEFMAIRKGAYGYISKPWLSGCTVALPMMMRAIWSSLREWKQDKSLEEEKKRWKVIHE